jgi:hypothetical protein
MLEKTVGKINKKNIKLQINLGLSVPFRIFLHNVCKGTTISREIKEEKR